MVSAALERLKNSGRFPPSGSEGTYFTYQLLQRLDSRGREVQQCRELYNKERERVFQLRTEANRVIDEWKIKAEELQQKLDYARQQNEELHRQLTSCKDLQGQVELAKAHADWSDETVDKLKFELIKERRLRLELEAEYQLATKRCEN